jgi:hypothetical protein
MATEQIPNSTGAFPASNATSQAAGGNTTSQSATYLELVNQDTVALSKGMLVSLHETGQIIGVVRAATTPAGPIGIVREVTPVGAVASIVTTGVVQAIADGTITAGHWLVGPATTAGSVADGAIANTATTAAISGLVVGFAITGTTVGLLFWMFVETM